MIPVMIVDDEKLTIEDLSTLVDWQACGYEITAENFTVFLQEMRTRILRRRRDKEFLEDSVAVSYISAGEQEDLSAADLQGTSSERFSRPVESAVSYIRRHYADPDLSMGLFYTGHNSKVT